MNEDEIKLLVLDNGNKILVYQEEGLRDTINIPNNYEISYFFAINDDSIFLFNKSMNHIDFYDVCRDSVFKVVDLPKDTINNHFVEYRPSNSVNTRPYKSYYGMISIPLYYYSKTWSIQEHIRYMAESPTHIILNVGNIENSFLIGRPPKWCSDINMKFLDRVWNGLEFSSVVLPIENDRFILSHIFSDSIYIFNSNNTIIDRIFLKSHYVKMPPPHTSETKLRDVDYVAVTPKYKKIIFDDKREVLYRICEHGAFPEDDFKTQGNSNWSIIKYDMKTKKVKEYFFPGGYYNHSDVHLYGKGLIVSNKGYKNELYDKNNHSYTYFEFN
ncbi:MAG: DUF4221 domain-containing protein [Saprospiraceae bacterium]|nr:DUF4221 domain-containing protein [Saprospiraceae bacterium]MDW8483899.1 DUF4221 family protein [Saprospiraceae bacterium]